MRFQLVVQTESIFLINLFIFKELNALSSQRYIKFILSDCITDVVECNSNTKHISNKNIGLYESMLGSIIGDIHKLKSILQYISTTPNADMLFVNKQIQQLFMYSQGVNKSDWCCVHRFEYVNQHELAIKSLIEEYPELNLVKNIFDDWCDSHENLIKLTYVYNSYSKDAHSLETLGNTQINVIIKMLNNLLESNNKAMDEINVLISEYKTVILRHEYKSSKAKDLIAIATTKLEEAKQRLEQK